MVLSVDEGGITATVFREANYELSEVPLSLLEATIC